MPKSEPIDVWCPSCRTTFAPQNRRCIHCGGPLAHGRSLAPQSSTTEMAAMTAGAAPPSALPAEGPAGPIHAEEADLEQFTRGRNPVWIVTAVLIMLASMLRSCLGG